MRSILVAVLLILVVIVIYTRTIGGPHGMKQQVKDNGQMMNATIRSMNP